MNNLLLKISSILLTLNDAMFIIVLTIIVLFGKPRGLESASQVKSSKLEVQS